MEKQSVENTQKEIYASAYENKTGIDKEGKQYERKYSYFTITFDMDKVKNMEADKDGNIKFSVHKRKDADQLSKEGKPDCYLVENTFSKDKQIDVYSLEDIIVNKEDLSRFSLSTEHGERAYVNANVGELVALKSKYQDRQELNIGGYACHVDQTQRKIQKAENKIIEDNINVNTIGTAWKISGSNGDFFSIVTDDKKLQYLPTDDKGRIHFAIHELKEVKGEKAPTHVIVPESEFHTGQKDNFAVKLFEIKKSDLLSDKVKKEISTTIDDKTYTRQVTYINISEDNKVSLNFSKYPELKEQAGYRLTDAEVHEPSKKEESKKAVKQHKGVSV